MRNALLCSILAATSIWTGVAAAEDTLKGTYAFASTLVCLVAPDGFRNDSKGNLSIPIGITTQSTTNSQGQFVYNGDGTGTTTGTFITTAARPGPGAGVSAGTYTFSFTYAPGSSGAYDMTITPATYKGAINVGPAAGQQFTIDVGSITIQVSSDRKQIAFGIATPYIEKLTYSGSPQNPVARVCSVSGGQFRSD